MKPSVLLLQADFHGTLAAARSLGRHGVPVTVADCRHLVEARWSRHVTRTLSCPEVSEHLEEAIDWLVKQGRREPGQVLLPTTDDLAWLFAWRQKELALWFRLASPPLSAVYSLLNKWRLRQACDAVALKAPNTWLDPNEAEYPLVIKPQTQIGLWPHQKGRVVRTRADFERQHADFTTSTRYSEVMLELDSALGRPMLQQFLSVPSIYTLSGYVDSSGELFVVNASRKVLQRPRVLGIGLVFEGAPVLRPLARKLKALCRHVGYHGIFEVEFLERGDEHLLIDFNPRSFGQMAFDVARGADLPWFAYLEATGDRAALEEAVAAVPRSSAAAPVGWCDRICLMPFLAAQKATGAISGQVASRWYGWLDTNRGRLVDAVLDGDDWMPGVIAAASAVITHARHPRSTLRTVFE